MNPGPAKGFFIDKEQTRFYLVKLNSATWFKSYGVSLKEDNIISKWS
jgi:hypothetical protein